MRKRELESQRWKRWKLILQKSRRTSKSNHLQMLGGSCLPGAIVSSTVIYRFALPWGSMAQGPGPGKWIMAKPSVPRMWVAGQGETQQTRGSTQDPGPRGPTLLLSSPLAPRHPCDRRLLLLGLI